VSVPVYGAAQVPPAMLSAPVRVRCVARKLSASVMTVLALPASQPMPIFNAESSAAWSASCWSWFFCHSAEPASKTSAAEPMRAISDTATSTITCLTVELFAPRSAGHARRESLGLALRRGTKWRRLGHSVTII
jgi:hypothetical protein